VGTISYIIKIKPAHFLKIFEHTKEEKKHFLQKINLQKNKIKDINNETKKD
jgi:hypothetical protein